MSEYRYGASQLHGLPTPLDDTPLDATSWAHLVDRLHVGVPYVCASDTEQREYLQRIQAAGLGPSQRSIIRVTRTDLGGLTMWHDGTGWTRESGGMLKTTYFLEAAGAIGGGGSRGVAGVRMNHPCKSIVVVHGHVIFEPPQTGWAFLMNIKDEAGRSLSPEIRYSYAIKHVPAMTASVSVPVEVPAGDQQLNLWVKLESQSQGIMFRNAGISVHYA